MIRVETLTGADAVPFVPALARLRGEVFAEWPYLYRADPGTESEHLRRYAEGDGAALVVALDDGEAVGVATCEPMRLASEAVRGAFVASGRDPDRHCYFGESVLRRAYRGQGIGVRFFAAREAQARTTGHAVAAFCAVERDADDPRRPPDHAPLDGFWRRRGYVHHPELFCEFSWPEIGGGAAVPHRLSFWLKDLG